MTFFFFNLHFKKNHTMPVRTVWGEGKKQYFPKAPVTKALGTRSYQ